MRRIRFVKNLGAREGQGAGPSYEEGKTYEFKGATAEGYADAYIDRGFAVDTADDPAPVVEQKSPIDPPAAKPTLSLGQKPQGFKPK